MLYLRDRFWDYLFLMYVNDLPGGINDFTTPVIYAVDTSVLVTAENLRYLQLKANLTLH